MTNNTSLSSACYFAMVQSNILNPAHCAINTIEDHGSLAASLEHIAIEHLNTAPRPAAFQSLRAMGRCVVIVTLPAIALIGICYNALKITQYFIQAQLSWRALQRATIALQNEKIALDSESNDAERAIKNSRYATSESQHLSIQSLNNRHIEQLTNHKEGLKIDCIASLPIFILSIWSITALFCWKNKRVRQFCTSYPRLASALAIQQIVDYMQYSIIGLKFLINAARTPIKLMNIFSNDVMGSIHAYAMRQELGLVSQNGKLLHADALEEKDILDAAATSLILDRPLTSLGARVTHSILSNKFYNKFCTVPDQYRPEVDEEENMHEMLTSIWPEYQDNASQNQLELAVAIDRTMGYLFGVASTFQAACEQVLSGECLEELPWNEFGRLQEIQSNLDGIADELIADGYETMVANILSSFENNMPYKALGFDDIPTRAELANFKKQTISQLHPDKNDQRILFECMQEAYERTQTLLDVLDKYPLEYTESEEGNIDDRGGDAIEQAEPVVAAVDQEVD